MQYKKAEQSVKKAQFKDLNKHGGSWNSKWTEHCKMNKLGILCVVSCLLASTGATPSLSDRHSNIISGSLIPSQWLPTSELERIPSLHDLNLEKMESMPIEEGAKLMQILYHISQINYQLEPSFVPIPNSIPVYIIKNDGRKETASLENFVGKAKEEANFGEQEVTIFITGLPSTTETVKKANRRLIQAYIERYNYKQQRHENSKYSYFGEEIGSQSVSEESLLEWNNQKSTSGNIMVIDLGSTLKEFEHFAKLNIDGTGALIGKYLVKLTNDCNMPQEIIHVVAQGIAAHVAGAAGNEYTRLTGHQLRRITALDPSKILARDPKVLTGLARGNAEFVDAIHTSAFGMGTLTRVGDVDFYPNGPCTGVPGARNVVEASMRATHYFAETVYPGNERNFPAVKANSLKEYKDNNGFGKRVFMGVGTDYDLRGDYILEVNEKNPFGMRTPAQKQKSYHGIHEALLQYRY